VPLDELRIDRRFCGPPRSANGGYTCGRLAAAFDGTVSVRLKAPPPLAVPLGVERSANRARLLHGAEVIAEAMPDSLELDVPQPPGAEQVAAAARRYAGFTRHSFPSCFVCGPQREPGDGLRIFAGALNDTVLAAPWVPDESLAGPDGLVRQEFLWAALDCPGAFAVLPLPAGATVVLGQLTASITDRPRPGAACTVLAWPLAVDGRKRFAATAVFGPAGQCIARARAIWIEVPTADWR